MVTMPLVATLGSHSALQILKGARDEGLRNLVIGAAGSESLYQRYPFVDEVIGVPRYDDFPALEDDLRQRGAVIVPHGSFVAYLGREQNERMRVPYYGNKAVLRWEGRRDLQRSWLESKVSDGGTAMSRVHDQLAQARQVLREARG